MNALSGDLEMHKGEKNKCVSIVHYAIGSATKQCTLAQEMTAITQDKDSHDMLGARTAMVAASRQKNQNHQNQNVHLFDPHTIYIIAILT